MGQFSWLDCKTGEQVVDGRLRNVYVLVPEEFGGGHILEPCYDGYGHFGGFDIYDLVTDWNRGRIPEEVLRKPDRSRWGNTRDDEAWYDSRVKEYTDTLDAVRLLNAGATDAEMQAYAGNHPLCCYGSVEEWKRSIGIKVSCYDDQNAALKYPIKITHDPDAVYEQCGPSDGDPNQGWAEEEEDKVQELKDSLRGLFYSLESMIREYVPAEDGKITECLKDAESELESCMDLIDEIAGEC